MCQGESQERFDKVYYWESKIDNFLGGQSAD